MEIITRKEAKAKGLTTYFTGKPCVNGHLSPKYTGPGSCIQCLKEKSKNSSVSVDTLSQLLDYNQETGDLIWKKRGESSFDKSYAGKVAGNKYTPRKSRTSYLRIRVNNRLFACHRVVWAIYYREWPDNHIDHIDGDGTNNRIANLRLVTSKDNSRNCRLSKNNTTGVNGVWQNKHGYVAEIMVNRKKISLGSFKTLEEAKAARKAADKIYGFFDGHGEAR